MSIGYAPAAAIVLIGQVTVGDALTGIALVGAAVATLAVGRVKNKDNTIDTLSDECAAMKGLLEARDKQLVGAQERADREHEKRIDAESRVAKCEGQIEELRPYGEAFKALISRVERTEAVIGTAIQEQGELVMKNTEVAARSVEALESMTGDLKQLVVDFGHLAERLGAGGDRPIGSV